MLITHERDKLINAIVYFAQNTEHLGKTKLYKLLYLLDFEHFRQTGRNITGLDYYAWKLGPVPVALDEEIEEPEADLDKAVTVGSEPVFDHTRMHIKATQAFDASHFSKRELRLLQSLTEKYKSCFSKDMVSITHEKGGAWDCVFADGQGYNKQIPYELAVSGEESALILEKAKEYKALCQHFAG
jgi:uncharacterized phage-associated protein